MTVCLRHPPEPGKLESIKVSYYEIFLLNFDFPAYLLDFLVSGHSPLYIALLLEPGADGLQGTISTAPAIVIHVVLHVVVVAVDPLNHIHLEKNTNTHLKKQNS